MRSTEEIAASIIEEIRNAEPAADVDETVVHGLIKLIHKGTVPRIRGSQFGNRKQNKDTLNNSSNGSKTDRGFSVDAQTLLIPFCSFVKNRSTPTEL